MAQAEDLLYGNFEQVVSAVFPAPRRTGQKQPRIHPPGEVPPNPAPEPQRPDDLEG